MRTSTKDLEKDAETALVGTRVEDVIGRRVGTVAGDAVDVDGVGWLPVALVGIDDVTVVPTGSARVDVDVVSLPFSRRRVRNAPRVAESASAWPVDQLRRYWQRPSVSSARSVAWAIG